MICDRTDCMEIYYAVEFSDEELAEKLGPDGCDLAEGKVTLTEAEAKVIYDSVVDKRDGVNSGIYDQTPGEVKITLDP